MKNFNTAYFDAMGNHVSPVAPAQSYEFNIQFPLALPNRGCTGVISDRILLTLQQLGVAMQSLEITRLNAKVTIAIPLNVTLQSVIDHVAARVNSVMQALLV